MQNPKASKTKEKPISVIKVGVIGYSSGDFKEVAAKAYINDAFNLVEKHYGKEVKFKLFSGLTNMGIPKLAYENATDRGWETVGIAPRCAEEYEHFPCDLVKFVGQNWGDESDYFISSIHLLIKVGGGKQSEAEKQLAIERGLYIMDYDL